MVILKERPDRVSAPEQPDHASHTSHKGRRIIGVGFVLLASLGAGLEIGREISTAHRIESSITAPPIYKTVDVTIIEETPVPPMQQIPIHVTSYPTNDSSSYTPPFTDTTLKLKPGAWKVNLLATTQAEAIQLQNDTLNWTFGPGATQIANLGYGTVIFNIGDRKQHVTITGNWKQGTSSGAQSSISDIGQLVSFIKSAARDQTTPSSEDLISSFRIG
jgi:hypothetical protein